MTATQDKKAPLVVPARTDAPFVPFARMIREAAAARPEAEAIVYQGARIPWRAFYDRISRLAARLVAAGLEKGDRVAIMGRACPAYVEIYFAVLHAGGIVVPLPMMASPEAVETMLNDSGSRFLFADADAREAMGARFHRLAAIGTDRRVSFEGAAAGWHDYESWLAEAKAGMEPVEVAPEEGFNIIYSSGTTGVPKGILQSNRMRAEHISRSAAFGYSSEARTLISTPLYSNTTLVALIPTLALGGTVVLMRRFDVAGFLKLAEEERVTHAMLVPVQYERILADPAFDKADLSSFRMKLSTSAPLRAPVIREILDRWPGGLISIYGLTEGGPTCVLDAAAHPDKLDTVGVPAMGTEIRILDDAGNEMPVDQVGEIVGRNPAMMSGYHNRGDLTEAMIWHDEKGNMFFRSGDLGARDADGFIRLMGRKKDMIISGGFNIYACDLEDALLSHEAVEDAAVIGIPSREWGETPIGLVVLKKGMTADAEEIRAHANARLGKLQRLAAVEFRDVLPRSSIGKVLKRELAKPYWDKVQKA